MKERQEILTDWQRHVSLAKGVHPDSVIAVKSRLLLSVDSIIVKLLMEEAVELDDPHKKKNTVDLACRLLQDVIVDLEQGHKMPKSGKVEDSEILNLIARHASAIEGLKKLILLTA